MTPFDSTKKMKSKYYCQLCKRGIDNEGSFKAHLVTPSHLLQKSAYDKNPSVYTEYLSGMFARQFLEVLWKKFDRRAASVHRVYFMHLSDPTRVRLTSTKWVSLGEFLDWLDKNFKDQCNIIRDSKSSETFIQLLDVNCLRLEVQTLPCNRQSINVFEKVPFRETHQSMFSRKPKSLFEKLKTNIEPVTIGNKRKSCRDENSEMQQIKCARRQSKSHSDVGDPFNVDALLEEAFAKNKLNVTYHQKKPWPLSRDRVSISFNPSEKVKSSTCLGAPSVKSDASQEDSHTPNKNIKLDFQGSLENCVIQAESSPRSWRPVKLLNHKQSALEELKKEQEEEKERQNRSDNWLCPSIIVRIVTTRLGKKYHKHKALVLEVKHKYTALLQILDSKDTLLYSDQRHLKPVVPDTGKRVAIINGAYRGHLGILKNKTVSEDPPHKDILCSVVIDQGILNGRPVKNISCDDVAEFKSIES